MKRNSFFFLLSYNERRGLIILCSIICLVFIASLIIKSTNSNHVSWEVQEILIEIDESKKKKQFATKKIEYEREINTMQVEDWKAVCNLSTVSFQEIIRYRKALGGFYKLEQITEAVAVSDTTMQKLKKILNCNQLLIEKIKLTKSNMKKLEKHPYIGKSLASTLVSIYKKYPQEKSFFNTVSKILSSDKIVAIKSYLIFDKKEPL